MAVLVIGAGPAGLATAAELKRRGVDSIVLERGPSAGSSWQGRYDRLRLHTTRGLSGLPGYPIPRDYPRWLGRDDMVRYLYAYAEKFALDIRTGVTVRHASAGGVTLTDGAFLPGDAVVVATGNFHTPWTPPWPGLHDWGGRLLHAADYRDAAPFAGEDVLVAGLGNSGAEIASDLVAGGAASVTVAVRTPPHIAPRDTAGFPGQWGGLLLHRLPASLVDALGRLAQPDLRRFGLSRPVDGLATRLRTERRTPLQDVGFVADLKAGRVRIAAAVEGFNATSVLFADGSSATPSTMIAATGYTDGLRDLVGEDRDGLYFVGYRVTMRGGLYEIATEAREVAAHLSHGR